MPQPDIVTKGTKMIPGLPRLPRIDIGKPPAKKGPSVRKGAGLEFHFHNDYLMKVVNPKGKLPVVLVGQSGRPGWTVSLYDKPYTQLGYGYRKADKLAVKLALRGHKTVHLK